MQLCTTASCGTSVMYYSLIRGAKVLYSNNNFVGVS